MTTTKDELAALYREVMAPVDLEAPYYDFDVQRFAVRIWDGMDGCWSDIAADVPGEEALRIWNERTRGGTVRVRFSQIDYVRLFPAGTRMTWDGGPGREMFRPPNDEDND